MTLRNTGFVERRCQTVNRIETVVAPSSLVLLPTVRMRALAIASPMMSDPVMTLANTHFEIQIDA